MSSTDRWMVTPPHPPIHIHKCHPHTDTHTPAHHNSNLQTIEQEDRAALQAALAMSMAESADAAVPPTPVGPGLPLDFTGNYELFGVVTHKVRGWGCGCICMGKWFSN